MATEHEVLCLAIDEELASFLRCIDNYETASREVRASFLCRPSTANPRFAALMRRHIVCPLLSYLFNNARQIRRLEWHLHANFSEMGKMEWPTFSVASN